MVGDVYLLDAARTSVVSAFEAVARGKGLVPVPQELVLGEATGPSSWLSAAFTLNPISPQLWFFRSESGTFDSPQRPLFGLYLLRAGWRGCPARLVS